MVFHVTVYSSFECCEISGVSHQISTGKMQDMLKTTPADLSILIKIYKGFHLFQLLYPLVIKRGNEGFPIYRLLSQL